MPHIPGNATFDSVQSPVCPGMPLVRLIDTGADSSCPDDFANGGFEELDPALEETGITFQINIYPNSGHAFHNDMGALRSRSCPCRLEGHAELVRTILHLSNPLGGGRHGIDVYFLQLKS